MGSQADMRVLIVEDDKLLNWSLVKSLSNWGFEVHPTSTGHEAMEEFRRSGFDIILLDYQLPDLDGLEVAREIRRSQSEAVVFLLTAFQLNELTVDDNLIDGYFNKPIDLQQLRQALKKIHRSKARAPNAHENGSDG